MPLGFEAERDLLNFDRQLANRFEPVVVGSGIFFRLFAAARYDAHEDTGSAGVEPGAKLTHLVDIITQELHRAAKR
jgi:hypothetical protein